MQQWSIVADEEKPFSAVLISTNFVCNTHAPLLKLILVMIAIFM